MDICFVKSNEYCGPQRTLCTIHGKQVVVQKTPLPAIQKRLPRIVRVQVEGEYIQVQGYWRDLVRHLTTLWPHEYETMSEPKKICVRKAYC